MRRFIGIFALLALIPALSACGGSGSNNQPTAPAAGQGGGDSGTVLEITAKNLRFDKDKLTAPANTSVTVVFHNQDQAVQHNFAVYDGPDAAETIFKGQLVTGVTTQRYQFTTPGPGTYFFRCDVHPDMMTGELTVQ